MNREEIYNSVIWSEIKIIINERINNLMVKLVSVKSWDDVCKIQGQIQSLKSLIASETEYKTEDFNGTL